jgi:glutamine cyclotransferase
LYANIWYSAIIVEMDPRTGAVTRTIDCAELQQRAAPRSMDDVLNGIAYDAARDVFYLTGKNWRVMFEVRIPAPAAR